MTLLSTTPTPNGNYVELHEEDGHYAVRTYVLAKTVEISEAEARRWQAQVVQQVGGRTWRQMRRAG